MNLSFLKHKKINQVVWLGAGDLAKADLIFNAKTTVHLVDADEAIIERLHKRFKQNKSVTIHPLLISDNNNNTDFSYYSLNEFNGIAQPAALKQRYPGLKQLKKDNKKATAISTFMTNVDLVAQKNNAIILDLPGLSARLLQTLIDDKTIHSFSELVVLTSQESLFEGDLPANDLIDLLEKNGFLCQTHKSSYQDYVIVQAELNPLYKELTETKNQLANAQSEIKNNQTLLIKAQKESEGLLQEKHSSDQLLADAVKQKKQQQIEYQNQVEKLKKDKQELLVQIEAFKSQDEKGQQIQAELNAKLKQYTEQIEKYELEREQFNKQIEEQKNQLLELNKVTDELTKANVMLEQKREETEVLLNKAKNLVTDLQQQVDQLTQDNNKKNKCIDDEKTENDSLTQTNKVLTEELTLIKAQANQLLTEKELSSKELVELRNQVEALSNALEIEKHGKLKVLENNKQLTQQNIQLEENIKIIDASLNKLSQGFEGIESLLG